MLKVRLPRQKNMVHAADPGDRIEYANRHAGTQQCPDNDRFPTDMTLADMNRYLFFHWIHRAGIQRYGINFRERNSSSNLPLLTGLTI